jgi:hypothetical protein
LYPFCGDVVISPYAIPFIIFSSQISQDSKYLAALSDVRLEGSNEAVYFVLRGLGMKASPGRACGAARGSTMIPYGALEFGDVF